MSPTVEITADVTAAVFVDGAEVQRRFKTGTRLSPSNPGEAALARVLLDAGHATPADDDPEPKTRRKDTD